MKPKSNRNHLTLRRICLASLLLTAANSAYAQSTWNSTGGGSWSAGTNWTGGIPDSSTAIATFSQNFTANPTTINLNNAAGFTVNRINYEDTGTSSDVPLTIAAGTGGGKLTLAGTTPTVNTINNVTISAVIDGVDGLTKIGAGTLTLSGANTYTGATSISAGSLSISGSHAGPGGFSVGANAATTALTFSAGSTISMGTGALGTVNGGGSGNRGIVVSGSVTNSGNVTILGRNSLTIGGSWTMSGGTLTIQPLNTGYSSTLTVSTGGSFTYSGSNTIIVSKATGSNDGNGTLNLSGTFTTTTGFSNSGAGTGSGASNFNFDGGTLKISNNITSIFTQGSQPFSINLAAGGGIIDTNTFNTATSVGIVGVGGLEKKSAGTLTLSGTNTYAGTTTISGGTLQLGAGGTTGALTATTGITNNGNLTVNRSNDFTQAADLNGQAITGTGSFTQAGAGTTVLSLGNGYTGTTTISGGTLQLGAGGTTGGLTGTSGITNNGNLTVNRSNAFTEATDLNDNDITGTGSFTQAGTGTTTLSRANSYAGGTTVSAGTLVLANNSAAGVGGGVTITGSNAAILQINDGITIGNAITFSNSNAGSKVARSVGGGSNFTTGTTGDFKSSFAGGTPDTIAELLEGSNSGGATTLDMSFSASSGASNDFIRRSDIFNISGTGSDTFVVQLKAAGLPSDSFLGMYDSLSNSWIAAGTTFYTAAWATGTYNLGDYGFDSSTGSAWAVVNGSFSGSFTVVPEPTTALSGVLLTLGLLRRRRRD